MIPLSGRGQTAVYGGRCSSGSFGVQHHRSTLRPFVIEYCLEASDSLHFPLDGCVVAKPGPRLEFTEVTCTWDIQQPGRFGFLAGRRSSRKFVLCISGTPGFQVPTA